MNAWLSPSCSEMSEQIAANDDVMTTRLLLFFRCFRFDLMSYVAENRRREKREETWQKEKTHVTILALVAALKTFSAPCTAGSIRSSSSRPLSGFMMTGLAVWMRAVHPQGARRRRKGR